jgi:ClpP class serine protease
MRLLRVMAAFAATPWALDLITLEALAAVLERADAGQDVSFEAFAEAKAAKPAGAARAPENVAVIPVHGVIAHRAHMVEGMCGQGGASAEILDKAIRAAVADPTIRSIVLDIDSPGGSVYGVAELADTIFSARRAEADRRGREFHGRERRVLDRTAAHELYVIPSGEVGSIGVYMKHTDTSKADEAAGKASTIIKAGKYKAEISDGPLSDDAKAHLQDRVDAYYTQFAKAVAKHRGVAVTPCATATARAAAWAPPPRSRPGWSTASRRSTKSFRSTPGARRRPRTGPARTPRRRSALRRPAESDDSRDRTHANTLKKDSDMKSFSRKNWPLLAVVAMLVVGAACAYGGYIDPTVLAAAPLLVPIGLITEPNAKVVRELLAKRQTLVEASQAIVTAAGAANLELTAEQNQTIDAKLGEISAIDAQVKRLNALIEADRGAPVAGAIIETRPNVLDDPKRGFRHFGDFAMSVRRANPEISGTGRRPPSPPGRHSRRHLLERVRRARTAATWCRRNSRRT